MGKEDKSSVQLLREYAQKRNDPFYCAQDDNGLEGPWGQICRHPASASTKTVYFHRDRGPLRAYYVAVDGKSSGPHPWQARCGVYSVVRFPKPFTLVVSPQDIIDDIFNIFTRKDIKIGHAEFDKSFFIRCDSKEFACLLLRLQRAQDLISQVCLLSNSSPTYFLNEPGRFFEPLGSSVQADESVLGFETRQNWITDNSRIDILFESLKQLTHLYLPILTHTKNALD